MCYVISSNPGPPWSLPGLAEEHRIARTQGGSARAVRIVGLSATRIGRVSDRCNIKYL